MLKEREYQKVSYTYLNY